MVSDFLAGYDGFTRFQFWAMSAVLVSLGLFWLWVRLEFRPKLKPGWVVSDGTHRLQSADKHGWIWIPKGTKYDLASWRKNPDKLEYQGRVPYLVAEDFSPPAKPDDSAYALWRRDCLLNAEGSLSDSEFCDRWRGCVPRRPTSQGKCPIHCWPWVKFAEGENCPECEEKAAKLHLFDGVTKGVEMPTYANLGNYAIASSSAATLVDASPTNSGGRNG